MYRICIGLSTVLFKFSNENLLRQSDNILYLYFEMQRSTSMDDVGRIFDGLNQYVAYHQGFPLLIFLRLLEYSVDNILSIAVVKRLILFITRYNRYNTSRSPGMCAFIFAAAVLVLRAGPNRVVSEGGSRGSGPPLKCLEHFKYYYLFVRQSKYFQSGN